MFKCILLLRGFLKTNYHGGLCCDLSRRKVLLIFKCVFDVCQIPPKSTLCSSLFTVLSGLMIFFLLWEKIL